MLATYIKALPARPLLIIRAVLLFISTFVGASIAGADWKEALMAAVPAFPCILGGMYIGQAASRSLAPRSRLAVSIAATCLGAAIAVLVAMFIVFGDIDKVTTLGYRDSLVFFYIYGAGAVATLLPNLVTLYVTASPRPLAQAVERAQASDALLVAHSLSRLTVIDNLLDRAERLRTANWLILVLVLAVLNAAAAFVVFAGQIASKDTQSLDAALSARKSVDEQEALLLRLEEAQAEARSKIEALNVQLSTKGLQDKERTSFQNEMAKRKAELASLEARAERTSKEYARRQALLASLEENALKSQVGTDDRSATQLLIAAGVTRIGILVLTFYLVQILVSLYRYNAQLASQALTQANALLLTGDSASEVGEMITKLRFNLTFGRPETPLSEKAIDKVTNLIKSGIDRARSGSSSTTVEKRDDA